MLRSYERGYAVMSRDLKAYSFEDTSLESCKRYCREDCVIVERIPIKCGFSLRIWDAGYNLGFNYDKYSRRLSLGRLQILTSDEFRHKIGKIVYDPKE